MNRGPNNGSSLPEPTGGPGEPGVGTSAGGDPLRRRPKARPSDRRFVWACVAAVLLFGLAYSNSLRNAFHFDDSHVVVNNLHIRDISNIPSFFLDARTFSTLEANAAYRPLVTATLAVDYAIGGGLNPVPFHVTQLLLFAAVGVGVFLLALHLFREAAHARARERTVRDPEAQDREPEGRGRGRREPDGLGPSAEGASPDWPKWAALFAAALFCLHTANTQTGNYITARSEPLSALGILAAFLLYIHRPRTRRFHLYLVPVLIGALAKMPAVMFAPLLLFYRLVMEDRLSARDLLRRENRTTVGRTILACAPAFALGFGLYYFVHWMQPPGVDYGGGGRLDYLRTQTWVWVRYARLFFVPVGLTADSDLAPLGSWLDPRVAAGALLLVASLVAAELSARHGALRPVAFGLAWFWVSLIPTASIFPFGQLTNDHRVFLPYIGLTIAVVGALSVAGLRIFEARPSWRPLMPAALAGVATLVLVLHAGATHQRNLVWRSAESLWADVAEKSPRNGRGLMNYGLTFLQRGDYESARDLFLRARERLPNYSVLEVNLGIVHGAMGDEKAAEAYFRRAIQLAPGTASSYAYYARWLTRQQGRSPEALENLERAVEVSGGEVTSRHQLLHLLAAAGRIERLRQVAEETLAIAGTDSVAAAMLRGDVWSLPPGTAPGGELAAGLALTNRGENVDAARAYRQALTADPEDADAWNNLGFSLVRLGFYEEAIEALETALRLRPDHERAGNNLAWARQEIAARR